VISFAPDIGNPVRVSPTAALNGSGQYELTTGGQTGAPPGKYKVCVSLEQAAEESRLKAPNRTRSTIPSKYRQPETTTLVVEVVPRPSAGAYDLKLSAK
jgi:hypothetical protein